jgi:hypothetical protein
MMFAKDHEAQEKLATMKPQKPRFLGLQNKDKPKIRKPYGSPLTCNRPGHGT